MAKKIIVTFRCKHCGHICQKEMSEKQANAKETHGPNCRVCGKEMTDRI